MKRLISLGVALVASACLCAEDINNEDITLPDYDEAMRLLYSANYSATSVSMLSVLNITENQKFDSDF